MKVSPDKKKLASAQRHDASRKRISQIELLNMRVAAAEDTWKQAKEQFSQAKRRRKLAKVFARRAKKYARTAKAKLELARKALVHAKEQSMTLDWPAPKKVGKTKNARPPSRKQPTRKRSVRKATLAAVASSHGLSPAASTAKGFRAYPNPAASLQAMARGQASAIC
jgi:hypothetical protein